MTQIPNALIERLRQVRHLVVLTGAGVSAESGIPTFRDPLTGHWARFSPQELATPEAYVADPAMVWGWYEWRRAAIAAAQPNPAHRVIADWARRVPKLTLITQNIDDLHERAGSQDPIHLHGEMVKPRCFSCQAPYAFPAPARPCDEAGPLPPPRCACCDGTIRPGVVWFGESLPLEAWWAARSAVRACDLILVVGTSGAVRPAVSLVRMALDFDAELVQVNPTRSVLSEMTHFDLIGAAGEVLPALDAAVWGD